MRNHSRFRTFCMSSNSLNIGMKRQTSRIAILVFMALCLNGCNFGPKKPTPVGNGAPRDSSKTVSEELYSPVSYDFYIENSGSMRGYFSGRSEAVEIVGEFYHRIGSNMNPADTLTLNYINSKVVNSKMGIDDFLASLANHCTAQYSNIDDILDSAVSIASYSSENHVSILVSDFYYTTANRVKDVTLAKSGIQALFTKARNRRPELSAMIYKYESEFNGIFYPGNIRFHGYRPFYVWVIGPAKALGLFSQFKESLSADHPDEGQLVLESNGPIDAKIVAVSTEGAVARAIGGDGEYIRAAKWKKGSRSGRFTATARADLSDILLPEESLADPQCYSISNPDRYQIDKIAKEADNSYSFEISSSNPLAEPIEIDCPIPEPKQWIDDSNTTDHRPVPGKTFGIGPLINGAYAAYNDDKKGNYFTIIINVKTK